jgi:beta-lactamase regulating signal transducer with metallopeptidase domain/dienelactone hydrolase
VVQALYGANEQRIAEVKSPLAKLSVLFLLWPLGVVCCLFINLFHYARYAGKLKRHRIPARPQEQAILAGLLKRRRLPALYRSRLAPTPMTIGVFKPAIVLPDLRYSEEQLQNILTHELIHLQRRDVLVKWLSVLAGALHWFNPAVYVARREIDRICELACDELVIKNLDNTGKQSYGETLLAVSAEGRRLKAVLTTSMCEEKKALKERLSAILQSKKYTKMAAAGSVILLAGAICLACAIGSAGSKPGANPQEQPLPTSQVTFKAEDGLTVYADLYKITDENAPYIILYHMADSGRGEYSEIAPRLNEMGYNCLAIDQRIGDHSENKTVAEAENYCSSPPAYYTEAWPDLKAALLYVKEELAAAKIIIWGSSYSASLAFVLGSVFPQEISAILSFSPAEYFTFENKSIAEYALNTACPVFIAAENTIEQEAKVIYGQIPGADKVYCGIDAHGSGALYSSNKNSAVYWRQVSDFLQGL